MMKPVAIFGGTFDPVHLGHLRAAWEAAEQLDAEVRMMPARVPPHRPPTQACAAQRVALLRAALGGQDRLTLDTRELDREGPSYSVDTLADLRRELGPEQPLVLLVGADAFAGLDRWDRWQMLFERAHIGVMTRPGVDTGMSPVLHEHVESRWVAAPAELHHAPCGRVARIPVTALEISASSIRAQLAAGRSPRFLVPGALLRDPTLLDVYRG